MDGLDLINRKRPIVLGVPLDEPLEPIAEADDFDPLFDGLDGHGADDAIDPRGRAAADQQRQFAGNRRGGHGFTSLTDRAYNNTYIRQCINSATRSPLSEARPQRKAEPCTQRSGVSRGMGQSAYSAALRARLGPKMIYFSASLSLMQNR